MIILKIQGFDVADITKATLKAQLDTKIYQKDWMVPGEGKHITLLIFTNHMLRIDSNLTVTVILEFTGQSEALVTIVGSGGRTGLIRTGWGAEKHCEKKVEHSIRRWSSDWVIEEVQAL